MICAHSNTLAQQYSRNSTQHPFDPFVFAIERMTKLEITADRFRYPGPRKYDPEEMFKGSIGIFQDQAGTEEEVTLRFAAKPWLHRYLTERTWHPSQSFKEEAGGSVVMTMTLTSTVELVPWIRSFGDDVEVVGPASLKADL